MELIDKQDEGWQRRLADIVVTGGSLLALSPLFVLIALAIKLDSRGPVLYRQERVGKDEVPFEMLKFRSMVAGADRMGPKISGNRDPRVTRLGHLLRRTKVDELPQLWNVLRGDMTLVGPRAEVPEMIRHYTPEERWILSFKPGLTGPGQIHFTTEQADVLDAVDEVEAFYVEHQLRNKLAKDLKYLETRGWAKDADIIWRTVKVILSIRRPTA